MGEPLLVSVPVACRVAADPPIGRDHGYQLVRSGAWRSVRIGRRVLVVLASVREWVEREIEAQTPVKETGSSTLEARTDERSGRR